MAMFGIGYWVVASIDRLCHSRTISIVRSTVKATKAATWSHPSALFSIIGTRCLVEEAVHPSFVGWSSRPSNIIEMLDTHTANNIVFKIFFVISDTYAILFCLVSVPITFASLPPGGMLGMQHTKRQCR